MCFSKRTQQFSLSPESGFYACFHIVRRLGLLSRDLSYIALWCQDDHCFACLFVRMPGCGDGDKGRHAVRIRSQTAPTVTHPPALERESAMPLKESWMRRWAHQWTLGRPLMFAFWMYSSLAYLCWSYFFPFIRRLQTP